MTCSSAGAPWFGQKQQLDRSLHPRVAAQTWPALLELEPDTTVCGRAPDGRVALTEVARLKPDVLVTDVEMPGMSCLPLAAVRDQFPRTAPSSSPPSRGPATCAVRSTQA